MKKRLTVLALAFAMVLTMSGSVFAATPQTDETRNALDSAYLVKYLQMEEGVANPNTTFTFTFTKLDANNPTLDNITITPSDTSASGKDGASVVGKKSISEIVGNKFVGAAAGVYSYKVNEVVPTAAVNNVVTSGDTKTTYSSEEYQLNIFVKNKQGGGTEIEGMNVSKKGEGTNQAKVDPTDEDPTDGPDETPNTNDDSTTTSETVGGFSFTNQYVKEISEEADGTDAKHGVLEIKKAVVGDYADKQSGFNFTLTLTAPASFTEIGDNGTAFTYYDNGTQKTLKFDNNRTWTASGLSLADAMNIQFAKLPAGTKFTVEEQLTGNNANAAIKDNDKYYGVVSMTTETGTVSAQGAADKLGTNAKVADGLISDSTSGNVVTYTNTLDSSQVTPTGIIINNLPYVLLIGLAIGGIVLFSRKRRYE